VLEQCRAEVEAALGRPITDQMAEALEGALLERLTTALRADPEGFRALPPAIRLTRAAEDLASQGVARARARLRQAQEAARGGRVNQDGPDGSRPRGQTELGDNPVIRLGEAADESTFLHEGAHYYLDLLERLAARGDAPQAVTARYEAARRWLGAAPGEALTREQHERFADSFLAYVREGRPRRLACGPPSTSSGSGSPAFTAVSPTWVWSSPPRCGAFLTRCWGAAPIGAVLQAARPGSPATRRRPGSTPTPKSRPAVQSAGRTGRLPWSG
jgi:hypothetical protein